MKRLCLILLLALALCSLATGAAAKKPKKPCKPDLTSCPPEGCGGALSDPRLNEQKNRTDMPDSSKIRTESLDFLANLKEPDSWKVGQERSSIQGKGKEGTPITVAAFLL